jgi:acetylornithine deacetylase/succinyl-diaminopimelate desuccinylase-like protein
VWRLLQALASLTTPDGNTITISGYHDAIRPPSAEEMRLLRGMFRSWDEETYKRTYAVERWIDGLNREQALERLLFTTTLNVDGIWAGYTGPGTKTILPHKATAKIDSRLVPDQTPEQAIALIRRHLDDNGFSDVEIEVLGGYPPAQTSVTAPLVEATISVFNKHRCTPTVAPRIAGSPPYYVFTELGLPMLAAGLGHGSGAHAPNEYMVLAPAAGSPIKGLVDVELAYVDLLYALAQT